MGHEKTVKKENKKEATKSLKEKRLEKKAKKDSKKNNWSVAGTFTRLFLFPFSTFKTNPANDEFFMTPAARCS